MTESKGKEEGLKRAIDELRRSNERFQIVVRATNDAVWDWNLQTDAVWWNEGFQTLFGYRADEVEPGLESWVNRLHPEDQERVLTGIHAVIDGGGQAWIDEYRFRRQDGSYAEIFDRGYVQCDKQGRAVRMIGAMQDTTERKRAEEALRESEQLSRSVLENIDEIIYMVSAGSGDPLRGTVQFVSGRVEQVIGYKPDEFVNDPELWFNLLHPDDVPAVVDSTRKIFQEKQSFTRVYRLRHKHTGQYRWMEDRVVPRLDDAGAVVATFGVARDITDQKRAEEALRASEKRFRTLIENSSDAIVLLDADGVIIDHAPRTGRVMGYANESLVGRDVLEMIHPEDRALVRRVLNELVTGEAQRITLQFRALHRTGSSRWAEAVAANHLGDPEVKAIVVNYRDITERKRAEEALAARVRQQAVVAELGLLALAGPDLQRLFDQAVARVAETFGVEYSKVLELLPDGSAVKLVAGVGWKEGLVGQATVGVGRDSQAGFTLLSRDPVIVEDLRTETRFSGPPLLRDHGVVSGLSVIIGEAAKPFGVMGAHTAHRRAFTPDDVNFFQSVANVLAEAIQRHAAEAELQESEERFRQLSDAAFEAIILHDQGTILEVNQSFCRMYGYERAEIIGKSVLDLALPEFHELLLQRMRSGGTGPFEGPALRKDGTIFRTEIAAKPIHYQGRPVRVAAIRDITEQKRNERRQAAQYAVTRVLAESATLAEATPQLLRVICESLRWKMGECWRLCDSTNVLRCVETWHVPELDATSFIAASRHVGLAPGVGLPGRVWQSGQPAWIPDVMTDPRFARAAIAGNLGLRGAVAFPILLGNHTLGVMLFFSRRAPEVDEDLLKMMSAIGSQIGQFTERKQAEEALLASELKYRDIFAFAPVGIYQSLRDGTIITANHTLAEMLGYASVDELLRVRLGRDVYLVDGERERLIREDEVRNYPVDLELQWKKKDGSPIWIQLSVHAIKGANGVTEYWEGFVRDITELKRAEAALRQTEQQYESLMHSIDGIVWEIDPRTFSFTFVSKQTERLLGYPPAQWLNEPNFWANHIHPDDREWAVDFCLKATARKEDHQFEYRMIAADGRAVWLKDNVTVSIMDDESVRLRGVMVDITERRRAEEALLASERKYRDIFTFAPVGIYQSLRNGTLITANKALAEMLTYDSVDEFLKVNLTDVYFTPDERQKLIREYEDLGYASDLELRWKRKDGVPIWVQLTTHAIKETGLTKYFEGFVRDITERKLQEEALHESETMLKHSQRVAVLGHYVLDVATGFWTSSEVLDEILGIDVPYTRNVEGWLDIVHPEQRDEMDAYLSDQVLKERNSFDREYRIVRINDSAVRWVHGLGNLEFNTEGQPARMFGVIQDITERKLIEEELRESEERYRDLVENSREFVCTHDLDGLILSANRAASEVLGYDLKDYCGKRNFRELLVPEVRDQFDDYLARIRRDGVASGLTLVKTSSGEQRILEYHNTLRTEGVATPIVRGMARDITEQRRAEKAMSDLRRELELTMSSMEEGVHRVDLKGNIVFENPAAARMLGWEVAELLGKRGHLTMHHTRPDGTPYPQEECPIYATFRDGVSRHVADEVFWRQDGTSFPVEYQTAPMRNDRNEIVATVVTFRDITARKRAEEALRESEERYRELFENAKDAIYVHDLSGRYVSVNRAAEQLSGFSREEVLGKHFSNFVAPRDLKQVRTNLCRKLDDENETIYEVDMVNRDGRRIPVEVSSRLIYENGVAVGVQGTARDITDRKRAREALRIYSQKLIAAQEAERQKIARELHDEIGQVLTAVRINLQTIQRSFQTADCVPPLDESIGIVDEALERVRELSIELRPSLLDDLGLTAALRWYVDRYAQRTGIIAQVLDSFAENGRLPRDLETACFRIAQEALTNVVRHAQAGSVSVHLERSRERMLLTIIDDGVGFDVGQLSKSAAAGHALGLLGMEERALAVGGHIEIESGLERGTRIRATFPLKRK